MLANKKFIYYSMTGAYDTKRMVIMLPILPLINFFTFNLITNSNIDHRQTIVSKISTSLLS